MQPEATMSGEAGAGEGGKLGLVTVPCGWAGVDTAPPPTPPPAAHFLPPSLLTGICNLS